ncbi:OmpH family outer membrane protein [Pseudomonadota bacterium]
MFKNIFYACITLVALVSIQAAQAEEMKLGYVNLVKLMSESPQVRAVEDRMRKTFQVRNDDLLATKNKLNKDKEAFVRDSASMTREQRQHADRVLTIRQRELKLDEIEFKEEVTIRSDNEMKKVRSALKEAIQEYGRENKFYMIFADGVVYADDVADVTDAVISKLEAATPQ